jgi:hypothetical protein
LLLNVIKDNGRSGAEDKAGRASVKDLIRLDGRLDSLNDRVRKIPNLDELFAGQSCLIHEAFKMKQRTNLRGLVQHSKSIPSHEDSTLAIPFLAINRRILYFSLCLIWQVRQLEHPVIRRDGEDHCAFRRVETESPWWDIRASEFAYAKQANVGAGVEVVRTDIFVSNVVECVLVDCKCWAFALQFEHYETAVMPCELLNQ